MAKKTAVYGTFETTGPVKQRYWIRRRDGFKQRYWKKTKRMKKVVRKGRYEFRGRGDVLYRAVAKSRGWVSKGYVDVEAEEFLEHPEKYGRRGEWIEWEVES